MSLKAELQLWAAALDAYDEADFRKSLELFSRMEETSKVLTNMGLIFATVGEHETAVQKFIQATNLDQYLAVAYFQCGVSNFLLGRFSLALKDFKEARLYLRGNQEIRYDQLGLKFVLHCAEVIFNQGLTHIYLGRMREGMELLREASAAKVTEEHEVIDEAIQYLGDQYTVFSIPAGVLYRPNENKLRNARAKDYLGKARLVAASDGLDAHTEFTGATRLKQGITPVGLLLMNPEPATSNLSRSNTLPTPSSAHSRTLRRQPAENQQLTVAKRPPTLTRPKSSSDLSIGKPDVYARNMSVRGEVGFPDRNQPSTGRIANSVGRDRFGRQQRAAYYYEYFDSYRENSAPSLDARILAKSDRTSSAGPDRVPGTQLIPGTDLYGYSPHRAQSPTPYGNSLIRRHSSTKGRYNRRLDRMSQSRASSLSEEEGYASWSEYDDDWPRELEPPRIRVKLHYQDDIRGMTLVANTRFNGFVQIVTQKFNCMNGLEFKFKDEDGVTISLKDESDYDLAIETACSGTLGTGRALEGKLEIWCADL